MGPAGDPPADGRPWILRSWLASRLLTLLILVPENIVLGDVRYYHRRLDLLFGTTGLGDVLREYPVPAMVVFIPPRLLAGGTGIGYVTLFVVLMVAVDAAFTATLWRASDRRPSPGLRLWLLLAPCLGPLVFSRFDLVAAALAGAAVLALAARRPVRSGLLAAAGAAVKLWPAGLLPALLVVRGGRARLLAGFVGLGLLAVGVTLAVAGNDRLVSPLSWQDERGLQIESVFAVPVMWARVLDPDRWP